MFWPSLTVTGFCVFLQGSGWAYHHCDCSQTVHHQDCWHYCWIWEGCCDWAGDTQWTDAAERHLLFPCNAAGKGKFIYFLSPFHKVVKWWVELFSPSSFCMLSSWQLLSYSSLGTDTGLEFLGVLPISVSYLHNPICQKHKWVKGTDCIIMA